jgi:HSP20 family protein
MFDQMQRRFFGAPLFESMAPWRGERSGFGRLPHLDFEDTPDAVIVHAEIPGVDPKDLQLECREDVMTIRAESKEDESREEGGRFRRYASFYRQVPLPPDADVDRGEASCKNGVLTVRFPKRSGAQNVKRIPISGEARREAA